MRYSHYRPRKTPVSSNSLDSTADHNAADAGTRSVGTPRLFHRDGRAITHAPGTEDESGLLWGSGSTFNLCSCLYLQRGGARDLPLGFDHFGAPRQIARGRGATGLADRRQTPSRDDLISIAFLIDDGVTLSPHCRLPESGLPRAAPRRMVR